MCSKGGVGPLWRKRGVSREVGMVGDGTFIGGEE